MCRTLDVWRNIKNIRLPEDIRRLLEATYEIREDEGKQKKLKEIEKLKLEAFKGFISVANQS